MLSLAKRRKTGRNNTTPLKIWTKLNNRSVHHFNNDQRITIILINNSPQIFLQTTNNLHHTTDIGITEEIIIAAIIIIITDIIQQVGIVGPIVPVTIGAGNAEIKHKVM